MSPAPDTVSVLLPGGVPGPLDYLSEGLTLARGMAVSVPVGKRSLLGVVWGPGTYAGDPAKLKPVEEAIPCAPLPGRLCDFVDWVAAYVVARQGAVLSLVLRAPEALFPAKTKTLYRLDPLAAAKPSAARSRVIAAMGDGLAREKSEIAALAAAGAGTVAGLIAAGVLSPVERPADAPFALPDPDFARVALDAGQTEAAQLLSAQTQFGVTLLDGVTGSGKTETYFEAVAATLKRGRQALILLPEIALTHQFLDRFEARFGVRPAEWHSDLKTSERTRVWRGVHDGSVRAVAGARSALFLPFAGLGLIVADEEHDQAYKQEEGLIYNARDMAVARGRIEDCPVILASATPSLETYVNAVSGRYAHVKLVSRFGPARMPKLEAVDMRASRPASGRFLAPALEAAVEANLAAGEQSLLFLNRRGYAPLNICKACGHRIECPHCASWLVEHRFRGRLVCHHCGHDRRKPETCEACAAPDSIVASGPGVERIAEEVKSLWPEARVALASSDTLHGPRATQEAVRRMEAGEIDILIGTQIVAKGHNFPNLTLVGVVDADLGLKGGDPRARERVFQLLHQVSGRAGRAEKPGRVLLQTHDPSDRLIAAILKGDRDGFLAAEAHDRESVGFPPYGRLAALILSSADESAVEAYAKVLAAAAPLAEGAQVFGPAPAMIARLRGRTRLRFLVQAKRAFRLQAFLSEWIAAAPPPGKVRLAVDVDPMSFF